MATSLPASASRAALTGVATGRRIAGTITGGTGRYDGVVGEYDLTWQYVARDDDALQGRAIDLRGRIRKGAP